MRMNQDDLPEGQAGAWPRSAGAWVLMSPPLSSVLSPEPTPGPAASAPGFTSPSSTLGGVSLVFAVGWGREEGLTAPSSHSSASALFQERFFFLLSLCSRNSKDMAGGPQCIDGC